MKQIDPVGAIDMTKAVLSYPLTDITREKLPPHAQGVNSPTTRQTISVFQH